MSDVRSYLITLDDGSTIDIAAENFFHSGGYVLFTSEGVNVASVVEKAVTSVIDKASAK